MIKYLHSLLSSPAFSELGLFSGGLSIGHGDSKFVIIVGENSSGKSFSAQGIYGLMRRRFKGLTLLPVSMQIRSSSGMHKAFMYGAIGDDGSTGVASVVALNGALRAAASRDKPCLLLLDEPDLGLAEDYCYAMGQLIAQGDPTSKRGSCAGVILVTHSRELVRGVIDGLPMRPHFLHMGEPGSSLSGWLERPARRSVEDLRGLAEKSLARFREISKLTAP